MSPSFQEIALQKEQPRDGCEQSDSTAGSKASNMVREKVPAFFDDRSAGIAGYGAIKLPIELPIKIPIKLPIVASWNWTRCQFGPEPAVWMPARCAQWRLGV